MNLTTYAQAVQETMMRPSGSKDENAFYFAACLAGETGELINDEKKVLRHGWEPRNEDDLISEVGDILWYVQAYCITRGITLEQVMQSNVSKLRERYPNGFKSTSR